MSDAEIDKMAFNQCLRVLKEILTRHGFDFRSKPWIESSTLRKIVKCLLKLERNMGNSLLQ